MAELELKQQRLKEELSKVPSLVVAYSGGVDSAYLAYAAHQVLGERMLAVTALSASYSARDRREAEACVRRFNFPHEFIETDELSSAAYRANRSSSSSRRPGPGVSGSPWRRPSGTSGWSCVIMAWRNGG